MKPRYYVHMGPKAPENISCLWKASHIILFLMLLCSSSIATACIYNILNMYKFNCIIYAKVTFEKSYEERLKEVQNATDLTKGGTNGTDLTNDNNKVDKNGNGRFREGLHLNKNCSENLKRCKRKNRFGLINNLKVWRGRGHPGHSFNETNFDSSVNNTGFINMRKTVFATIYMCDLMLFAPMASIILSVFLGAMIAVGGKGGAGNPGDLLPNPWICVYPFLGLCGFMTIFCFISDNLYHNGLATFCSRYFYLTKSKVCSEHMDKYNLQFSEHKIGPPKPFYQTYWIGSIGVQFTSALWVIQTLVYVFRILCLADFSLYLTRIKIKGDEKGYDAKIANVVFKVLDYKSN